MNYFIDWLETIGERSEQMIERVNIPRYIILVAINMITVTILIILSNAQIVPASSSTFFFWVVLCLLFALYRPYWAFWLFIGMLPLEIINLAPESWGMTIRPYQLAGVLVAVAVVVRIFTGRAVRKLFRWRWVDSTIVGFVVMGFVATVNAHNFAQSFKQAVIVGSFAMLYFLTRYFVRGFASAMRPLAFFLSSAVVVLGYGIWQNMRFLHGMADFAIMPGRPNATFSEPDWLGIYVVVVLALICGVIYRFFAQKHTLSTRKQWVSYIFLELFLVLVIVVLIITVARSAWIGAVATALIFGVLVWWHQSVRKYIAQIVGMVGGAVIIAMIFAQGIPLTNFVLGERVASTAGAQEITIACGDTDSVQQLNQYIANHYADAVLPNVSELAQFSCQHINLEEIDRYLAQNQIVTTILRKDPTIDVRTNIYRASIDAITAHWLLGNGWRSSGEILGTDTHGNMLNTSNIILEIWLSVGIIGLVLILAVVVASVWRAVACFVRTSNLKKRIFALFVILVVCAIAVPNMFNAGLLMGFVWVFLGVMVSAPQCKV